MEVKIETLLNNVDPRTIKVYSSNLYPSKLVIQHCGVYGNPNKTEYIIDHQQAVHLAKQILKHYNEERLNED